VAVALCACGGSPSSDAQQTTPTPTPDAGPKVSPPSISAFSASPSQLPVGGGVVTLQWTVAGATQVTIDQSVGDVTGKSSTSTSVTGPTRFTLTATNADGAVTQSASVSVAQALTVSGKVIDAVGKPTASATVVIGALPAAVTDAEGHFSISGVAPPFDATVVGPNQQSVVVYQGLTAPSLTLTLLATSKNLSSANLYGSVNGGTAPYTSSNAPFVAFSSSEVSATGLTTATSGAFAFDVSWANTGSTTGTLFALQPERDGNGVPIEWRAFGRKDDVTLNAGASLSGLAVPMNPVSSSTLTGSVSLPSAYTVSEEDAVLELDPAGTLMLMSSTSGSTAFGFNVPIIPQSSYAVVAAAHPQNRSNIAESLAVVTGLTPGNNAISLTVPPVPNLATPVDEANAVDSNNLFVWSGVGVGGVYDLRAVKDDGGTPLQFDIITTATQTHLPDLSALGLTLPGATDFYWQVYGLSPFTDINDVASSDKMGALFALRRSGSIAESDYREFTTR
jgi:hypothetical protein